MPIRTVLGPPAVPLRAASRKAMFKLVEKKNPLAVHGLFDSRESAERHLKEVVPGYVARGYFMDKTLTAESFEVVEK